MPSIDASVDIEQSPDDVFTYLTEAENLPVWDVSVMSAERLGTGPTQLGSRTRGASKIMGKRFDWVTEVTEFVPSSRVTYTSVEGPMRFSVTYTLEPSGTGTHLSTHLEAESGLGGVFGRLADPLIVTVQGRTIRANLDSLADLITQES